MAVIRDFLDIVSLLGTEVDPKAKLQVSEILETLIKSFPGSAEVQLQMARIQLFLGDSLKAENHLTYLISKSKTNSKANLMMAEIYLDRLDFHSCLSQLDLALSFDFQVRGSITFILLKAKCLNGQKHFKECLELLNNGFKLSNVVNCMETLESKKNWVGTPSYSELAAMFLERIVAETAESTQDATVNTAIKLFVGKSQETMFIIAKARIVLANNEVDTALSMLQNIKHADV